VGFFVSKRDDAAQRLVNLYDYMQRLHFTPLAMHFLHIPHAFFSRLSLYCSLDRVILHVTRNKGRPMSQLKRIISVTALLAFAAVSLSACSPNRTEVANWWYDNQWESASNDI
jgi:hypothetical protein